ncbi:MAG: efflux RND transporter permease subunit [Phycisphaerales bacterium]
MDIVRLAISKPVGVAVGVILLVMFGIISLTAMPVQLTPNVDRPEITITTNWPGRSPQEIVDEIVKEQEEQLKNVANLKTMRSTSQEGQATITMEFYLGTDIARALQEVSDKLRQVSDYPDDVDEPTIKAADGAAENAIAWIIFDLDPAAASSHPDFDIASLFRPIEDEIKPFVERIDGVAEVNVFGGRDEEVRILVDPTRLAELNLNHLQLLQALRAENRNISAGTIAEGKRDYRVRVLGQFESPDDVLDTIIAYRDGKPVYVRDVATVEVGLQKERGFVRSLGQKSIAMNVIRQSGANTMEIMDELRVRLDAVRADILPNLHPTAGPDLRLRQVYDETTYITSAIDLVTQNLWIGGLLAAAVLLIFLRSFIATGVVALAIPISVVGTFMVMLAMGRSLNVISLAGLAFAVGMVVDNAIVVLENIDRHLRMHKHPMRAAYEGGKEVWGAILASTLTTVAVFIPVLTVEEEAGQLFRDISIAIVASVALSLLVSITVIPAACSRWLREVDAPRAINPEGRRKRAHRFRSALRSLFGIAPIAKAIGDAIASFVYWTITGWRAATIRPLIILALAIASIWGATTLVPPMDYLPAGNRNLVFGGMLVPPGQSVEQFETIANRIESHLNPYAQVDPDNEAAVAALPPIPRRPGQPAFEPVPIHNYFIGAFGGSMFVGATSEYEQIVLPLAQLLTNAMNSMPDTLGFAAQTSLFGRGVGGGNTVDIEISGPELDRVTRAAEFIFNRLGQSPDYGYQTLRPDPSNFNQRQQEYQLRVTRLGRELGLRPDSLGTAVRALFDGAFVGDYYAGANTIDINMLPAGGRLEQTEQLADVPVSTPTGAIIPMDQLVELTPGLGPQAIQRIEELAAVTIRVSQPAGVALEQTIQDLGENYIEAARDAGLITRTMRIRLEGTAAKLDEVKAALIGRAPTESQRAQPRAAWQNALDWIGYAIVAAGIGITIFAFIRFARRRDKRFFYGALGALALFAILASWFFGIADNPQMMTARLVWALAVTYLLMAALFESFVYPMVIMFTVPLAVVGGFAGLAIVHQLTLNNPLIATQQLDVLTMLGFIILIGVVVNNAILLVHQSLNLMRGQADVGADEPLPPMAAIREAVRTRIRPIFMSTLTSVGGMLPLVLFPGAGSELYRGLGSVIVGGLVVSTVFTLFLVPLLFSLTLQMTDGLAAVFGNNAIPGKDDNAAPSLDDLLAARTERTRPTPATTSTNGDASRANNAAKH